MVNRSYWQLMAIVIASVMLVGCGGDAEVAETTSEITIEPSGTFSLAAIETPVPNKTPSEALFVETVETEVNEIIAPVPIVKRYEAFSASVFNEIKGQGPLALFFVKEDCDRCAFLDNFLSRNMGAMPNHTQVLRVGWDEFPNLQAELNVRRPATMVFYDAKGEVAETLLAPPFDRIIDFFNNAQPKS